MSSSQYLDALASERRTNRLLRRVLYGAMAFGAFTTWMAWLTPKNLNVHLAPNIAAGASVALRSGESDVPPANVYAFGYYIWQQINRWSEDGARDYGMQIYRMQNFVTPQCVAQLTADMERRGREGELRNRTRQVTEIAGFGYASNRVVADASKSSWTVFLDTQVQETFRGQPVKDIYIRFPIRVVRFDVDRERNPWQLAIDCYGTNVPARLNEADLKLERPAANPRSQLKVPALPGQVAPSTLPEASPLESNR
ncbi:MAG: PFL_4703 family integrating conjugative element protein [Gammaproteobacteria bacterium]|uniref:PFL_4703 family integrating conjugative element protein n=1 Tax=uncultured Pseudacidovorax sp. TaxID=679313 RepID=UPI0025D41497|nr:TIGR03746 family integrating conjugative element protein [uncultured Pseudacidovorax sp.]